MSPAANELPLLRRKYYVKTDVLKKSKEVLSIALTHWWAVGSGRVW